MSRAKQVANMLARDQARQNTQRPVEVSSIPLDTRMDHAQRAAIAGAAEGIPVKDEKEDYVGLLQEYDELCCDAFNKYKDIIKNMQVEIDNLRRQNVMLRENGDYWEKEFERADLCRQLLKSRIDKLK